MKRLLIILLGFIYVFEASASELSLTEKYEIIRLARMIAYVRPKLAAEKYFEYAHGIYKAAQKYSIDPLLLISIGLQESGLRDDIHMGDAGEVGIGQIRKVWLKNSQFIKEFGRRTIRDLKNVQNNFMFTAWILSDLKSNDKNGRILPYWCFYNARQFENRLRYYIAVNKQFLLLRKNWSKFGGRTIASLKNEIVRRSKPSLLARNNTKNNQYWYPTLSD